jgi:putative SOS response-associated peptidase YedK
MCGRYSISKKKGELQVRFSATVEAAGETQRYNVAPTQSAAIITSSEPSSVKFFRWGLIPANAANIKEIGGRYINARAETLTEKYPFARLLATNRCIVPADGFYEWQKKGNSKIPHRFTLKDDSLFAFAGLWDEWIDRGTGEIIHSFTIITVAPNELVEPVHNRMPAILRTEHERLWLDASFPVSDAIELLQTYPAELMKRATVSSLVNSPMNDLPEVLESAQYKTEEQGKLDF